jgi:hypothetical protein
MVLLRIFHGILEISFTSGRSEGTAKVVGDRTLRFQLQFLLPKSK